jgi:hypothetical protein
VADRDLSRPAGRAAGPSAVPGWRPYAALRDALKRLPVDARLARLDALAAARGAVGGGGRPLRFVAAHAVSAAGYERRIFERGEVATRIVGAGAAHDLCNALAWLRWPLTKAALNALHVRALDIAGRAAGASAAGGRGARRDAATLLDENGAVWVGEDTDLHEALRAFDWQRLFVADRERVQRGVRVHVLGHGLLERLERPYPAITAHAWPVRLRLDAPIADVDRVLGEALGQAPPAPGDLCPLPLMGLPGWCDANTAPAFYNDPTIFRPGRRVARVHVPASGPLPPRS